MWIAKGSNTVVSFLAPLLYKKLMSEHVHLLDALPSINFTPKPLTSAPPNTKATTINSPTTSSQEVVPAISTCSPRAPKIVDAPPIPMPSILTIPSGLSTLAARIQQRDLPLLFASRQEAAAHLYNIVNHSSMKQFRVAETDKSLSLHFNGRKILKISGSAKLGSKERRATMRLDMGNSLLGFQKIAQVE